MTSPFCWKLPQMQPLLNTTKKFPFRELHILSRSNYFQWRGGLTHSDTSICLAYTQFSFITASIGTLFYIVSFKTLLQLISAGSFPTQTAEKKQERPTSTSTSFFTLFTGAVLTIVLKHIHEYLLKKVIEKHSLRSWWYLRASTVVSPADTPIRTPRGFVFLLKGCPY